MKQIVQDLILLSWSHLGTSFLHLWTIIYPYYSSYIYMYDKSITQNQMFAAYLFINLGNYLAQSLSPILISIFAIKYSFMFLAILNTLTMIYMVYFPHIIHTCIALTLLGIIYQYTSTCANLYISQKYENGIVEIKYFSFFRMLFALIMVSIVTYTMNENNVQPTLHNQYGEIFFDKEISINYVNFCFLYGAMGLIFFLVPFVFLQDLASIPNQFILFLYCLLKLNFEELYLDDDIKNEVLSMSHYSSLSNSINKSCEKLNTSISSAFSKSDKKGQELLDLSSNKSKQLIDSPDKISTDNTIEQSHKDTPKFIIITVVLFTLNTTINYYCIDNFKYQALLLGIGDKQISFIFQCTCVVSMASNFIAAYVWDRYTIVQTYNFHFQLQTINLILIVLANYSTVFFIMAIFVSRFNNGYQRILKDYICYGLYLPKEAIQYSKYMVLTYLVSSIIEIALNWILFQQDKPLSIFKYFIIIHLIQLYILYRNINRVTIPLKIS